MKKEQIAELFARFESISKANAASNNRGQRVSDHLVDVDKMVVVKSLVALVLLVLPGLSCRPHEPSTVKRSGEPDVVEVKAGDPAMNRAMTKARETIGEFLTRLEHAPEGQTYLSLKIRMEQGGKIEHIWLDQVSHANGVFQGVIGNEPLDLKNVKLGDRVSASLDRVSDWMAVEHDRLIGGYTIRLLYDRMTPDERKNFRQETGFIME